MVSQCGCRRVECSRFHAGKLLGNQVVQSPSKGRSRKLAIPDTRASAHSNPNTRSYSDNDPNNLSKCLSKPKQFSDSNADSDTK